MGELISCAQAPEVLEALRLGRFPYLVLARIDLSANLEEWYVVLEAARRSRVMDEFLLLEVWLPQDFFRTADALAARA